MSKAIFKYYRSPAGELMLCSTGNELILCDWRYRRMRASIDKRILQAYGAEFSEGVSEVNDEAERQLEEYFSGSRKEFDLPLRMTGTRFQEMVWKELLGIPYGTTVSYLELSERLGDRNMTRAVASANGANALAIIIPCHRVIGADRNLTGYAGGLRAKKRLLELEKVPGMIEQLSLFP